MTERSPLRIFKGSKKEFRGLEGGLINNVVFIPEILETVLILDILFL